MKPVERHSRRDRRTHIGLQKKTALGGSRGAQTEVKIDAWLLQFQGCRCCCMFVAFIMSNGYRPIVLTSNRGINTEDQNSVMTSASNGQIYC